MRKYVSKVAPTKEDFGEEDEHPHDSWLDVARAILAVLDRFALAAGQRWILTDQRVYDWWDLASAWGESGTDNRDTQVTVGPQAQWVTELMSENNIKALPRSPIQLGRALDSRQFWDTFGLSLSAPGWNITPNVLLKDYPLPSVITSGSHPLTVRVITRMLIDICFRFQPPKRPL
ncbi:hypothetical protein PSTT_14890 [Puccinia striiformis]|uniref:Uncharacterized protein n=1 Tax=Puccinia striiformis TaxID=27350 RepID=A0A2S4UKH4_9BASI|nr:hypothetical protein PSTT_14890 [Puccinia striiformis]